LEIKFYQTGSLGSNLALLGSHLTLSLSVNPLHTHPHQEPPSEPLATQPLTDTKEDSRPPSPLRRRSWLIPPHNSGSMGDRRRVRIGEASQLSDRYLETNTRLKRVQRLQFGVTNPDALVRLLCGILLLMLATRDACELCAVLPADGLLDVLELVSNGILLFWLPNC